MMISSTGGAQNHKDLMNIRKNKIQQLEETSERISLLSTGQQNSVATSNIARHPLVENSMKMDKKKKEKRKKRIHPEEMPGSTWCCCVSTSQKDLKEKYKKQDTVKSGSTSNFNSQIDS